MMQKTGLIVEDEVIMAMDLQLMLEHHGWHVMGPAATVQEALCILEEKLPTIALLDVNLGTEFVTPVAETLRARNVPFVLASAYERPDQYGGAVLAGVPNVGKPVVERRLLAALTQLIVD